MDLFKHLIVDVSLLALIVSIGFAIVANVRERRRVNAQFAKRKALQPVRRSNGIQVLGTFLSDSEERDVR
jgi:hypothetical protein